MMASPFDKLMLIAVDPADVDKMLMKNNKVFTGPDFRNVFKENQDDIYRKDT
jgi:hypothetical protein